MAGERQRPLGRWGERFYAALALLAGLGLAVMTLAVFVQVVLRYVFTIAVDGLDEVPRYLFVWVVMIGAAAAMHRGEHTALEYFRERLSPRSRALAHALAEAAGVVLFLSLIRTSLVLVPNAQLQSSAGLGLPLGYVYAAVPVGAALIVLPMLWRLGRALGQVVRPWPRPS